MVIALDSRTPAFRCRLFSVHWLIRRNSRPPCEWIDGVSLATILTLLPRRLFLRLSMSKYTDHPIHYTGTGRPTCESKATRSGSVVAPHLSGYPLERCAPHMNEWVAGPHGRLVRDSLGHYLMLSARWGTGKAISDWIGGLRNFALLQILHRIKSHMSGKSFRVEVDGEETGVVVGIGSSCRLLVEEMRMWRLKGAVQPRLT